MGITGLIPFLEKASRRVNVDEFNGCTVAIDSYCWLHKGAFACAEKLVRGEETDIHIKYCLKYVSMLLAKNIKPILVFDGRHLPAKAMTEAKRRESRNTSKKRAAELLSLGQIEEARSYIRRSVDITHAMALSLIKECRKRNVDCIVAPYEADAQLAYLNIKNIAHLVITEDSDLTLFGCTKVLFKMDLEGNGILVETAKLPLVMKCPIERYSFDKFRQMCIMSGCDYLPSLPGIGLAKARQFVTATQDSHFANALRKLPSFFNKLGLVVTDEYRESFLKAEATFKHQYVYDAINRQMVRLNEPDDEDIELALCTNAGELLDPETALQLALGNLDPFTLKVMDDWNPDDRCVDNKIKTDTWKDKGVSSHATIWSAQYKVHLEEERPWQRRMRSVQPIIAAPRTRPRAKPVTMVAKYVPETQDESLTIESLSSMYCVGPATKKQKCHDNSQNYEVTDQDKAYTQDTIMRELSPQKEKSPILENRERSFKKALQKSSYSVLKRFSKFPRTVLDENVVASKFFSTNNVKEDREGYEESKIDVSEIIPNNKQAIDSQCSEIPDSQIDSGFSSSQKENSPNSSPVKTCKVEKSPILNATPNSKNPFRVRPLDHMKQPEVTDLIMSEDSVIENTYPMETLVTPVDSQVSFGASLPSPKKLDWRSARQNTSQPSSQPVTSLNKTAKRASCRVPGLKRTASLPSNQPTLLSKFGFQKRPVMKR